jgi:hypothetical protein
VGGPPVSAGSSSRSAPRTASGAGGRLIRRIRGRAEQRLPDRLPGHLRARIRVLGVTSAEQAGRHAQRHCELAGGLKPGGVALTLLDLPDQGHRHPGPAGKIPLS